VIKNDKELLGRRGNCMIVGDGVMLSPEEVIASEIAEKVANRIWGLVCGKVSGLSPSDGLPAPPKSPLSPRRFHADDRAL